jgi:hypothetical protein
MLCRGRDDVRMESTGLTVAAVVVVTLVAVTYALMIWASAHRS